jgi:hypothetical protein
MVVVVHAGEECFGLNIEIKASNYPDSYEFRIRFSPREINVAAASAWTCYR